MKYANYVFKKTWQEYELVKKNVSFIYLQRTPLFQNSFNISFPSDLLLQEAFLIPAPKHLVTGGIKNKNQFLQISCSFGKHIDN